MYNFEKIYEATHLTEKKDHLIKKIPELSDDEKSKVIDWFAKHPNRENEINWNNVNDLKYSDFEVLMKTESKTGRKNKVKVNGLQGLLEGTDFGLAYEDENIIGLVPFHYEASKLLASKYVGKVEAKWCTAYQKTDQHWKEYTQQGITFIYFINKDEEESSWNKIAVAIYPDGQLEIFSEDDDNYNEEWLYEKIEKSIIDTSVEESKLLGKKINRDFSVDLTLELLKEWGIDFTVDSQGFVNVEGDCYLYEKFLKSFGTIKFGTVGGDFDCFKNQLTSLEGSPQSVGGYFDCHNNQLTSLIGSPQEVGGYFECNRNQLTSLFGSPQSVGGSFECSYNKLTSLEGCPQTVGRYFDCSKNQLKSLVGSPRSVGGYFKCHNNQLTSLEGSPQSVRGHFDCSWNEIKFTKNQVESLCSVEGGIYV